MSRLERVTRVSRSRDGVEKVRVPNPGKPGKRRLDAPPAKAHRVAKRYRRRPKHPKKDVESE